MQILTVERATARVAPRMGQALYFTKIPCQGIVSEIECPYEAHARNLGDSIFCLCANATTAGGAHRRSGRFDPWIAAPARAQIIEPPRARRLDRAGQARRFPGAPKTSAGRRVDTYADGRPQCTDGGC